MLQQLSLWPRLRWPWLLLAFSALAFELTALFFQHGMKLEPCVMCIYERIAMLGILAAGVLGAIAPQITALRWAAFTLWGYAGVRGLMIAQAHVEQQFPTDPFSFETCGFLPEFPEWLPLHEWAPWAFNPTGFCGDVVWTFLGKSMPQWLVVCFWVYLALLACFALLDLRQTLRQNNN